MDELTTKTKSSNGISSQQATWGSSTNIVVGPVGNKLKTINKPEAYFADRFQVHGEAFRWAETSSTALSQSWLLKGANQVASIIGNITTHTHCDWKSILSPTACDIDIGSLKLNILLDSQYLASYVDRLRMHSFLYHAGSSSSAWLPSVGGTEN